MENFILLTWTDDNLKFGFQISDILRLGGDESGTIIDFVGNKHATRKFKETPEYIVSLINSFGSLHSPSQTDSLIVANLRAHLEALNNEYTEAISEDDSIEYAKDLRNQILLLEEILKLEKPIV